MQINSGIPYPLGATKTTDGWNFALFSKTDLSHFAYAPIDDPCDITYIPLDILKNKTGSIWHFFLKTEAKSLYYGWRTTGSDITYLDPYAKLLDSSNIFGNNLWANFTSGKRLYAIAFVDNAFNWQMVHKPHRDTDELIIYEMHVRGFTQHPTSKVTFPGTYKGIIEKIPYLLELGITAIELMPVFEWNEEEYVRINPKTKQPLYNFWGYSPISFFAPMQRFASNSHPFSAHTEFKEMVRELHRHGIEVILDVVFNHTAEGNEYGPTYSMKAFSAEDYYLLTDDGGFLNFSGCGNTLNCNNPVVQDLIVEALRHWAIEYKIDGFRFDLASILTRNRKGKPLEIAPLLERITQEAALHKCKLIAEPWDAAGLHQVGIFFQNYYMGAHRWKEWNDDYRSCVRRFIKGDQNLAGRFATKIAGSQDIYGQGGSPLNSINYITSHDGFTLRDLVSYNYKHNLENGEENRDGMNGNDSWNCGIEGPSLDSHIARLREKQIKNFMVAQFIALGIPMIKMGDEYGHTKHGNNNTWCHDTEVNYFIWHEMQQSTSLVRFMKGMIQLRCTEKLLLNKQFLNSDDVTWHGLRPNLPDWSETSNFVAYTLHDKENHQDLYIAFNASYQAQTISIPPLKEGFEWVWVVNTQALSPHDYMHPTAHLTVQENRIKIDKYSSIILKHLPNLSNKL